MCDDGQLERWPEGQALLRGTADALAACRRALGRSLETLAALTPLDGTGPWEQLADHCDDVRREIGAALAGLGGGDRTWD